MTLTDPNPVSSSRHFWISQKRCILGTKLLKNTNRKPHTIEWYHSQWPSVTFDPDFKVTVLLKANISNTVRFTELHSFHRTLIGHHTQSIEWYHFQWPWVTSDQDFKIMTISEVEYRKKTRIEDKATILHKRKNT